MRPPRRPNRFRTSSSSSTRGRRTKSSATAALVLRTPRGAATHELAAAGVRSEIVCDEVHWARVAPAIEARAKELWKAAGGSGGAEALEAYRLGGLLQARAGAGGPG